jgi:hypothetical protein
VPGRFTTSLADGGHSAAFYNDTHNEPGGAYADRGLGARPSLSRHRLFTKVPSPGTFVTRPSSSSSSTAWRAVALATPNSPMI